MSGSETFVDGLRRAAKFGRIVSALWQSIFALVFIAWGIYILLSGQSPGTGNQLAALLFAAGGIIWMFFVIRAIVRWRRPEGDPVNLQLGKYGAPENVARELEQDFAGQPFHTHRIYVGPHWVCYAWKTQVAIRRIDTLVWAYLERVRRTWNLIPLPTKNEMVAWGRDGRAAVLPMRKKNDVEAALNELRRVAPWMLVGYSDSIKESWNNDRVDLIAVVDRSRLSLKG
jgi:hypothetical protein